MPFPIERKIASIKEDRRADYLWDTKRAAESVSLHPNKFSTWWYAAREKMILLFMEMPGETAAELLAIVAQAQSELDRRNKP